MYTALRITNPAQPVLPIATVRRHLRVDHPHDDDLIALQLAAATALAEQHLSRALGAQTLSWTMAQQQPAQQFPMVPFTAWVLPLWLPFSQLFGTPVELPRSPVTQILAVTSGEWGKADQALDPSTWDVDLSTAPARIRLHPGAQSTTADHLTITFTAGYTAEPVPPPILHAILLITAWLYENRGDISDMPDLPRAADALLAPYRVITFGG
jgi:hypothetical protein